MKGSRQITLRTPRHIASAAKVAKTAKKKRATNLPFPGFNAPPAPEVNNSNNSGNNNGNNLPPGWRQHQWSNNPQGILSRALLEKAAGRNVSYANVRNVLRNYAIRNNWLKINLPLITAARSGWLRYLILIHPDKSRPNRNNNTRAKRQALLNLVRFGQAKAKRAAGKG